MTVARMDWHRSASSRDIPAAGASDPSARSSVALSAHNSSKKGLKKMADERVLVHHWRRSEHGVDIAQAALAAGHAVVATGSNTEAVTDAVGEADDLLVVCRQASRS
jgi:predicted nucleic acid-binding Zn ribbon protein